MNHLLVNRVEVGAVVCFELAPENARHPRILGRHAARARPEPVAVACMRDGVDEVVLKPVREYGRAHKDLRSQRSLGLDCCTPFSARAKRAVLTEWTAWMSLRVCRSSPSSAASQAAARALGQISA